MDLALAILFSLVAGAGTALSPCVLPVLPVVLGAGATGGRRRPLGVALGLAASLTFTVLALAYVLAALGLGDDLLRTLAIAVLAAFGIVLLVPRLAAEVEGRLSRLGARRAARRSPGGGDGLGSGLVLGGSLGLLYAPCAGPVLAAVITVSAAQPLSAGRAVVGVAYGVGAGIALLVLMGVGRRVLRPLGRRSGRLQQGLGAVMVLLAVAMAAGLDLRFQSEVSARLPGFVVNPTGAVEDAAAVRRTAGGSEAREAQGGGELESGEALPALGAAPDFTGIDRWFNTPAGRPLSLARELRGRVVLVDFWTYTCINCLRTFPYLKAWDRRYRDAGLSVVGVHTPEFPFERSAQNVAQAIRREGLGYPVAQDNAYGTWNAYGNQYWPAKYLIDARGQVRYTHFGEGEDDVTERAIRTLLAERGSAPSAQPVAAGVQAERGEPDVETPEVYLGATRAEGFRGGPLEVGGRDFGRFTGGLEPNQLAFGGAWRIGEESARALARSELAVRFRARRVFLVLGSSARGPGRRVRVELDGKPIPDALAGEDVRRGEARIRGQRLYRLVDLPATGDHVLRLRFDAGVTGYAFTFG